MTEPWTFYDFFSEVCVVIVVVQVTLFMLHKWS
jgi:hypothetical protein